MENEIVKHESQSVTPATLLSQAIDKNLDIDKLERLMAMQEKWEVKEAKKAFLQALSDFQYRCPALKKDKSVGYGTKDGTGSVNYSYTPLGSIIDQIKDHLKDCGLSYRWETEDTNNRIKITCVLSHKAGHSETNSMEGAPDASGKKNPIQQRGSTITYLQRYTLIGALGIGTADTDNDGKSTGSEKPKNQSQKITKAQDEITKLVKTLSEQAKKCKDLDELEVLWGSQDKIHHQNAAVKRVFNKRIAEIKKANNTPESAEQQQIQMP